MGLGIKYYGNRESVIQIGELAKAVDQCSGRGVKVELGYDEVSILYKAEEDLGILEKEVEAQVDYVIELEDKNKELEKELISKEWELEELKEQIKELKEGK